MTTAAAIRQMAHQAQQGRTENVVYRPKSGGQRTVLALVERSPAAEIFGPGGSASPVIHVTVLNDASAGISSADLEADAGGGKIDVAENIGGTAATRMIAKVARQDEEFVVLIVR